MRAEPVRALTWPQRSAETFPRDPIGRSRQGDADPGPVIARVEHVQGPGDLEHARMGHREFVLSWFQDGADAIPGGAGWGDRTENSRPTAVLLPVVAREEQPPPLASYDQARMSGPEGILITPLHDGSVGDPLMALSCKPGVDRHPEPAPSFGPSLDRLEDPPGGPIVSRVPHVKSPALLLEHPRPKRSQAVGFAGRW